MKTEIVELEVSGKVQCDLSGEAERVCFAQSTWLEVSSLTSFMQESDKSDQFSGAISSRLGLDWVAQRPETVKHPLNLVPPPDPKPDQPRLRRGSLVRENAAVSCPCAVVPYYYLLLPSLTSMSSLQRGCLKAVYWEQYVVLCHHPGVRPRQSRHTADSQHGQRRLGHVEGRASRPMYLTCALTCCRYPQLFGFMHVEVFWTHYLHETFQEL